MKKFLMLFSIAFLLVACSGSGSSEQQTETAPLTPEQEAALADSLSTRVDKARKELKSTTEKNVKEIDSLLNQL